MAQQDIALSAIWKSKLALSLIPIFVAVVAVPLAVTVLVVGQVGKTQIIATARTMERSNLSTVQAAGEVFQRLGQAALGQSSQAISNICETASSKASLRSEKDQAQSLTESGHAFAEVTQSSFDDAMHQSLTGNRQILSGIGGRIGTLFARSAHFTQQRVGKRVQSAILEQINRQMSERATQLSQLFDSYIQTNVNYLGLTSQMLIMYEHNPAGQKAVMDALVRRFPMMSVVSVLDGTGQETIMSAADRPVLPSELIDQSYCPYFKTAIADKPYVGIDSLPTDGEAPVLRLAVPIELYHGKAIGVLSATLSLEDLWDTIRSARFGTRGFAYVTDANGYPYLTPRHIAGSVLENSAEITSVGWKLIVVQQRSEVMAPIDSFMSDISRNTRQSMSEMHADIASASALATVKLFANANNLHKAANQRLVSRTGQILSRLKQQTLQQTLLERSQMQAAIQSQIRQGQVKNDNQMVAAAKTASTSLAQRIPLITAIALDIASRRLTAFALVIFTVSCALSCLIGFLLTGALVKPILRLSHGTRSLALGELDMRVDERAPAEIGDLAVAFNMMAASLQKSRADLTEAESQLVQSAKLASLGTLSAGVAHELNQPVAIVRGLAQQLKSDTTIPADIREDIEIIEGQTSRMMKIITHLRTFCRTGSVEKVLVDVNRVVHDCFILIDAQLRANDIAVQMELCKGEVMVVGDSNELEQVFINLITNARDAVENIPNACLTIKSWVADGQAILEFRDNGYGVPPSVAEHIFDPFFTTKEVGKGTGLGLSISHGLIQKHRGTVVTRNDGGAVFTITLPLAEADNDIAFEQINGLSHAKRAA
jgi:C4-dicarboxylate-specific signal transduction histidine kinase